ncbi:MAG: FHA domain-containing protein [Planctomycetes bacterium]|nr:FHA domain-containing protein [Planctomycetota bacterium]
MFTLTVESGPEPGQSFRVTERAAIGRLADNDVPLPDASVSRHHARLVVEAGRLLVRDLASANGTFVNDERIDSGELRAGDVLRIGKVALRVASAAAPVVPPPPAAAPEPPPPPTTARTPAPAPAGPPLASRIRTRAPAPEAAGGTAPMEIRRRDRILQYSPYARAPRDRGILQSDLDQRSALFKLGVAVLLVAFALAVIFLGGRLVHWLLPTPQPTSVENVFEEDSTRP